MIHAQAIQQAIDRQLEIERKAAAWDLLVVQLRERGADGEKLLAWVQTLQTGAPPCK